MATSPILVPGPKRDAGLSGLRAAPDVAPSVLSVAGAALAVIGLLDLGLTWVPFRFGIAEWEFGTVTASLNALPVVTLGFALLLAGALTRGSRLLARALAVLLLVLTLCIAAAGLIYATNLPFILNAAAEPAIAEGLRKSMVKTGVQLVLFPTVFVVLAIYGWRHSGRRR